MAKRTLLTLAALGALAATPGLAQAATIFGSLGNFDAVNNTGHVAHGFEIELEGLHLSDITDTFGGAGRGFPTTVERYGAPTVAEYVNGASHGVKVTYLADLSGDPSAWVGTPSGVYSTPGESCWTGGGSGYGPSTPCDHFGVGLSANPTRTTYSWLIEQTPGSATLINEVSSVLAPTWTVTPQAPAIPGDPAPPPVVMAVVEAPDPLAGMEFGDALWVKVFTTEYDNEVALEDLVGGNPLIDGAETETEWQLLQKEFGNPNAPLGGLENGGQAGNAAKSVLRRYEFYAFTGLYDQETHEALFSGIYGDSNPGPGDVGDFLGAQNAALNFGAFGAGGGGGGGGLGSVPEPAAWALMLSGFGFAGAALRRRRLAGQTIR